MRLGLADQPKLPLGSNPYFRIFLNQKQIGTTENELDGSDDPSGERVMLEIVWPWNGRPIPPSSSFSRLGFLDHATRCLYFVHASPKSW